MVGKSDDRLTSSNDTTTKEWNGSDAGPWEADQNYINYSQRRKWEQFQRNKNPDKTTQILTIYLCS